MKVINPANEVHADIVMRLNHKLTRGVTVPIQGVNVKVTRMKDGSYQVVGGGVNVRVYSRYDVRGYRGRGDVDIPVALSACRQAGIVLDE